MNPRPLWKEPEDRDGALQAAADLAGALAQASRGTVEGVLLYGSHLLGARPDKNSALDLVVVVRDYRAFYRALRAAGEIHRPVWLMTALSRVLPPNVIAFTPGRGAEGIAKCLIVSRDHLQDALGPRPKDHFLLGRLVQRVAGVWVAGEEQAQWLEQLLTQARAGVLEWVGPYVEGPFDAEILGETLLRVCYGGELRPEARDRSTTIFETQREHFRESLAPALAGAAQAGSLSSTGGSYRFVTPPDPGQRRRWDRHFRRSKIRATLRWLKHVVTFDNWLPYVHRKAERRLGTTIELSRLERRMPLIFLWPRVVRVLFTRPDQEKEP
jgi:hypothetical protein